jgi:hypothetical protein
MGILPNWGSTEIDVKVCPAVLDAHEAILLDLGIHHVVDRVGGLDLKLLQVSGPNFVHPVDLTNDLWRDNLESILWNFSLSSQGILPIQSFPPISETFRNNDSIIGNCEFRAKQNIMFFYKLIWNDFFTRMFLTEKYFVFDCGILLNDWAINTNIFWVWYFKKLILLQTLQIVLF